MKRIVLISCVSKKLSYKTQAQNLYCSPLFKYNLQYAHLMKPDKIFILSAEYGLTELEEVIAPYDKTLNNMRTAEVKDWARRVFEELKMEVDLKSDEIIFLAGDKYRKYLLPHIKHYKIPMEGMTIGKQLQYLKTKCHNEQ